eukprot:2137832-Amphidinium_carterae.1
MVDNHWQNFNTVFTKYNKTKAHWTPQDKFGSRETTVSDEASIRLVVSILPHASRDATKDTNISTQQRNNETMTEKKQWMDCHHGHK